MKIYLAAPWACRGEAHIAALQIEAAGHTLTTSWWDTAETDDESVLAQDALTDLWGVWEAEVFIVLNLEKSEGKAVETGLALAYGTPIIVVGTPSNIFHYLKSIGVHIVPNLETALTLLHDMSM